MSRSKKLLNIDDYLGAALVLHDQAVGRGVVSMSDVVNAALYLYFKNFASAGAFLAQFEADDSAAAKRIRALAAQAHDARADKTLG